MNTDSIENTHHENCKHCGTVHDNHHSDFCCQGCESVYQILHDSGLDEFYRLSGNQNDPINQGNLQKHDFSWLEILLENAEENEKEGKSEISLGVDGISCAACIWLIEKMFEKQSGSLRADVNPGNNSVRLIWKTRKLNLIDFAERLQKTGYLLTPSPKSKNKNSDNLNLRLGLCGAFSLNTMLFTLPGYLGMETSDELHKLFQLLSFTFATFSLLTGGSYFIKKAFAAIRNKLIHIDLPISIGIITAYLGSLAGWAFNHSELIYFDFISIFIFLMLIGRWMQEKAITKANKQNLGLSPEQQWLYIPEIKTQIKAEELKEGVHFELRPGQVCPVFSEVIDEDGLISLAWINGESDQTSIKQGDNIPAGAINVANKTLLLHSKDSWENSLLGQVTEEQNSINYRNELLENVIRIYIYTVISIAISGSAYSFINYSNIQSAVQIFVSTLVISCPCALGIAIPLVSQRCSSILKKHGVFVCDDSLWNRISKIRDIAFDKTGTLTVEIPQLIDSENIKSLSDEDKLALFTLVKESFHPVGRSIKDYMLKYEKDITRKEFGIHSIETEDGFGSRIVNEEHVWILGKSEFACKDNNNEPVTVFSKDGNSIAVLNFTDQLRQDALKEVEQLSAMGFNINILSGDKEAKVLKTASELGLDFSAANSEMSPDDKANWILNKNPDSTLIIGDGANDSLAFDQAGCRGAIIADFPVLKNKSDFYFHGPGIQSIRKLIRTASRRLRTIQLIFAFTVCYNISAIYLCLNGEMSPLAAAILMPLSSIVSIGIAMCSIKKY